MTKKEAQITKLESYDRNCRVGLGLF